MRGDMRKLYNEVASVLDGVDFGSIWRGFERERFALCNDSEAFLNDCIIPRDGRFLGNTSIDYEGGQLALWYVDDPRKEDAHSLASSLVHEMFHSLQRRRGERRYPNDLRLLRYPKILDNYRAKLYENRLLAKTFRTDGIDGKKRLLREFFETRAYRAGLVGDMLTEEYKAETIEGMAEYAGCKALSAISQGLFEERLDSYLEILENPKALLFDTRRLAYYSGCMLCFALCEAGIDPWHDIATADAPLSSLAALSNEAKQPIFSDDGVAELLAERSRSIERQFDDFFATERGRTDGEFLICGWDPMNMTMMNDLILCSHFIMLCTKDDPAPTFVEGPVVVVSDGSDNGISAYIV